eukprot:15433740-Alexandrium_andersonii.AAC.1
MCSTRWTCKSKNTGGQLFAQMANAHSTADSKKPGWAECQASFIAAAPHCKAPTTSPSPRNSCACRSPQRRTSWNPACPRRSA